LKHGYHNKIYVEICGFTAQFAWSEIRTLAAKYTTFPKAGLMASVLDCLGT